VAEQVLYEVITRLESANELAADARAVLVAALHRDAGTLDACIDQLPGAVIAPASSSLASASTNAGHVFLSRISVAGLRGVAARIDFTLTPRPGLVVVTGRNGSGKSSIAEAAEIALSGKSHRAGPGMWWKDGLRNLHSDQPPTAEVEVRIDGSADVVVSSALSDPRLPAERSAIFAKTNAPYDLSSLGWDDAIDRYRPVLTYTELSDLATAKPSELYDAIHNIIGLDSLAKADKLLTVAVTEHLRLPRDADAQRKAVAATLRASDDSRARELEATLKPSKLDLKAARAVLSGSAGASAERRATLEVWTKVEAPTIEQAEPLVQALTAAIGAHDAANAGAARQARELADILAAVISHREHDDEICPVCGQGRLDSDWLADAQRRVHEGRRESTAAQQADSQLRQARQNAQRLLAAVPAELSRPTAVAVDPTEAAAAWNRLWTLDDPDLSQIDRARGLRDRLLDAVRRVNDTVAALKNAAAAALAEQEAAWQPIAEEAAKALAALEAAQVESARVKVLTEARDWLRTIINELRAERVRQFHDAATAIWNDLRQDSNVTFDNVTLEGTNTRRHVDLDLAVDGTSANQAVLSQGELVALGLAIFLPRSCAGDSPFRFVIVDDPVQSMDPTKVDGLAQVLHRLAQERQVVVFTHDDRLLASLRRLGLPAAAYRVERGQRSAVDIELVTDAVDQYLRDADALAKDTTLPTDLLRMAVSGSAGTQWRPSPPT